MSYQTISSKYLKELENTFKSALHSGEATPELSYRPALDSFLRELMREIDPVAIEIIFEPKKQRRAGRPDWRFYHKTNLGVFGFIEAKSLDTILNIEASKFSEQLSRYLELEQNLILTDGIDFVFYLKSNNWQPRTLSLTSKPLPSGGWGAAIVDPRLEAAFREFFEAPSPRECSEEQLIGDIALRAARLSSEIAELVALNPDSAISEKERMMIEKLVSLKSFLELNHDPSLAENKPFADFVSQVLCFGLLYSHRSELNSALAPAELYKGIHQYWIDGLSGAVAPLRPFQELVLQLKEDLEPQEGQETTLSTWYDDCRHLLSFVSLSDEQRKIPDYHRLYERFFERFDSETRFDFGAFYTPKVLASFVVSMVDQVALTVYQESLFATENKLIDPCCGTGTFIEEILLQLPAGQTPTIAGFEILPAPYALAHYRLSLITDKYKNMESKVHVLLTNTLSDLLDDSSSSNGSEPNLFQLEQIEARQYASPPIIAVIGNPPSTDSTRAPHQRAEIYSRIANLIDDFRPPLDRRGSRQNVQKQLRNDFVRFIRWASDRVVSGPRGMIALVLPESFLEHGSYRYARKWLLENFQFIWALDIDADQRTKGDSASLFNTLQGRALLVAVKSNSEDSTTKLMYGSIADLTLPQKSDVLSQKISKIELDAIFPHTINPDVLHRFRPQNIYNEELWSKSWPLYSASPKSHLEDGEHSIFIRHSSALKLGATSLLVHPDRAILFRRTKAVADQSVGFSGLRDAWFSGQSKPPTEAKVQAIRPALKSAAAKESATSYLHRPFVNLWALLDKDLLTSLASMPGGGARPRPEVQSAFSVQNLAFTVAPSRRDIGEDLHRFVSFCWGVPDNDLCKRGNAQVLCRLYPDYKKGNSQWNDQPYLNIDKSLLTQLPKIVNIDATEAIVYYSFGLLCSSAYLEAFSGALFTTASDDSIPRLPISKNPDLFEKITILGKQLAELENPATSVEFSSLRQGLLSSFIPSDNAKLHSLRQINQTEGSVVLELVDANGITLFSTDPVELDVANFRVSGYSVLQEWIKWASYRYARVPLRKNTIEAFLHTITRIEQQIALLSELDDYVESVINSPNDWIICPS
jgi:hypothetical protein